MKNRGQSKMALALSKAVHQAIDNGVNTGVVGRVVLANETQHNLLRHQNVKRNTTAVSAGLKSQYGHILSELLFIIIVLVAFALVIGAWYAAFHFITKFW